jgi:membrane protein
VSFLGLAFMVALVLRYVPDASLPWPAVLGGAIITALLFTIGKSIIGLYLGRVAVGSPYGAGASVVVVIVWVYYSAQIFLFGAELTRVFFQSSQSNLTSSSRA